MCFSPKIKTPKVDTNAMKAVDPAPLKDEPAGILFGGDDEDTSNKTSSEVGGSIKNSKVELDKPKDKQSNKAGGGVKKSINTKAFGK